MIRENFKMALLSLRSSKLRSFLTMLGIIIGVAAVTSVVSIGNGVKGQVSGQISDLGSNVVTVTSGQAVSTDANGSRRANPSASIGSSTLTLRDLEAIKSVPAVVNAVPLSLISGIAQRGDRVASGALLIATTPEYKDVITTKINKGRFFTAGDGSSDVAVLGGKLEAELFGAESALGQDILVRGKPFRIVGVTKLSDEPSFGGPDLDSAVYIPTGAAGSLIGSEPQIFRLFAHVEKPENVKPTVSAIQAKLKTNHGGQEDFSVLTQEDLIGTIGDILNLLTTFISAIAAISLLVGGIGIMNIMLVSVTERTREIGIRKAIGATRATILGQFLIEALVLTLLGGALGVALAFAQGLLTQRLAGITPIFDPQTILLAFGISTAIGLIFGLAPAIKAARMRPIDALRYE